MIIALDAPDALDTLRAILERGGVAVVPCDTIYGIVGIAPETENRIRRLKGRGEGKPFLQLVSDAEWASRITGRQIPRRLCAYWPGPLTIVSPMGSGSIAIRVPDSLFLRRLILALGSPLYSTSVNKAGSPPLGSIEEIATQFGDEVDLIVDGGTQSEGRPSTIVDITSIPFRVVRQGDLVLLPADLADEL